VEPSEKANPRRTGVCFRLFVAVSICAAPPLGHAGDREGCCRREFWVVDTRKAPLCKGLDYGVKKITYWKYEPGQGLVEKSLDEFLAGVDPSLVTSFHVHGNGVNRRMALRIGDRAIKSVGRDVSSYRIVLWSWPSQPRWGMSARNNILAKARWSESQGYYLAWLVDQINPRTALSLLGHSYGARAVAAGLQGLASNRMAGYELGPRKHPGYRPMHAALVAAAMDNRWLWPGWRYGDAWKQVDHLWITRNPNDRILRFYSDHFLPSGVRALGLTGIPDRENRLGDLAALNLTEATWTGTAHRMSLYGNSAEARRLVPPFFFYENAFSAEEILGDPAPAPSDEGRERAN
jgi:hypothetical protein